jgi:hypothetical protein
VASLEAVRATLVELVPDRSALVPPTPVLGQVLGDPGVSLRAESKEVVVARGARLLDRRPGCIVWEDECVCGGPFLPVGAASLCLAHAAASDEAVRPSDAERISSVSR